MSYLIFKSQSNDIFNEELNLNMVNQENLNVVLNEWLNEILLKSDNQYLTNVEHYLYGVYHKINNDKQFQKPFIINAKWFNNFLFDKQLKTTNKDNMIIFINYHNDNFDITNIINNPLEILDNEIENLSLATERLINEQKITTLIDHSIYPNKFNKINVDYCQSYFKIYHKNQLDKQGQAIIKDIQETTNVIFENQN